MLAGAAVQCREGGATWAGRGLLALTLLLVGFGLLSVYSASSFVAQAEGLPDSHYFFAQLGRAAVGIVVVVAASLIDYRVWRRLAWPALAASALLLVLLLLPWTEGIAPRVNGARRWLRLGLLFQPSEIAKVAVVVWTAALAVKKQEQLHHFRQGLLPFLVVLAPLCGLVLLEPHFSAAVMLAALAGVVLFCAGARPGHFALLAMTAVPLAWDRLMSEGYRVARLAAFLDPEAAAAGGAYQLKQSLIAVGSGGVFGVGLGKSLQKLHYLPEPQNDFIFSIIAEEWGLLGAGALIVLFLAWSLLGLRIAAAAPDLFGRLLAVGLTAIVAASAFAHIGVTLGLLPTTGVNLPFISAGGTNLVLTLGATGILLNVARRRRC